MSNHIGRASILLTADTASFESEIVRARDTTQGALGDIRQQATEMGRQFQAGFAMASMAVGVLSATVGVLVKDQMELVSALGRTAQLANTTAVEIQKYTFAAKALGVEQDKLGDIFKDTQDKVGDFLTTGGGELKDFFEIVAPKVGLTTEKIRQMSGPDALQALYNSLEKANIGQSEMVFYMESIADEASLLIPLLKNNGEGFKMWEEAAKNAGAVMDEKTIKATQELNTSAKLLELSWQGAKNQFTQAVIPALSDMAGGLIGSSKASELARVSGERLVGGLKVLAKVGVGVGTVFQAVGTAIGGFAAGVGTFLSGIEFSDPISFVKSLYHANNAAGHVLADTMSGINGQLLSAADTMAKIDKLGTGATNATVGKFMALGKAQDDIAKMRSLSATGAEQIKAKEEAKKAQEEAEKAKAKAEKEREKAEKAQARVTKSGANLNLSNRDSLQIAVYQAYRNAGLNHKQAVAITAEVGRENDYNPKTLFGYHADLNQKGKGKRINIGMLSWNAGRGEKLERLLAQRGLLRKGSIVQSQEALDIMAQYTVNEMKSKDYRHRLKNFWNNPNADYEMIAKEMGTRKGYVGWAMYQNIVDGNPFDWKFHHNKRRNYALKIDRLMAGYKGLPQSIDIGKISTASSDKLTINLKEVERQAQQQANARYAIEKEFADEKTKLWLEYDAKQKEIVSANFSPAEQKKYLDRAEADYKNHLATLELSKAKAWQESTSDLQSEEERIRNEAKLQREAIYNDQNLDPELRKAQLDAITRHELSALDAVKLAKAKAWQEATAHLQSQEEQIINNAHLEMRTIEQMQDLDDKLKEAKIKAIEETTKHALESLQLEKDLEWQAINGQYQHEEERIKANADLERRQIKLVVGMDEALRTAKIKAVTDKEKRAIQEIKDAYQNELNAINDYQLTDLQRTRNSYADQHKALINNTQYNPDQKDELGQALIKKEEYEINEFKKKAENEKSAFYTEMGGTSELQGIETQYQTRLDMIKNFVDSEVMTIEEAEKAKQLIRMQYAQDMLGSLANSSKAAFGEQSRAYRAMFAMHKGVAIAQASIAMYQNISQAMAKGFPANVPLIAQAMTQGMGIIASIKSIAMPIGQAHDGIMEVPKSGTWNLEKGERVLPKHTAKALDDKLAKIGTGRSETKIIINNYSGEKTDVQQMPNGDFMVVIGKQMQQVARYEIAEYDRKRKRQGWS